MRLVDALTLGAVAMVVLLVSLPRLQDLAVRENEGDAAWLVARLGRLCAEGFGAPVQAAIAGERTLRRQLDDAELLAEGRVLRRHGYLFEILSPPEGEGPGGVPRPLARAWPWDWGRTGRVVFVWCPERGLLGHPNPDGQWTGLEDPPPAPPQGEGWRGVRQR